MSISERQNQSQFFKSVSEYYSASDSECPLSVNFRASNSESIFKSVSECEIQRVNQSQIQRDLINSIDLKNTQKIWIILLPKNMIFV